MNLFSCFNKQPKIIDNEPSMLDTIISTDTLAELNIKPFTNKKIILTEKLNYGKVNIANDKLKRFDTLFTNMNRSGFAGCVLVATGGKVLFEKCFGNNQSNTLNLNFNSIFQLASVSKTITATAVMLLVDNGYIDLDSSMRKYLPELPYKGVTIRHLLSHRSGLPNYVHFADDTYLHRLDNDYMDNDELLKYLVECPPPVNLAPDQRFVYCNTNYALLASIVERVSRMKFNQFLQKYIFEPLLMTDSYATTPLQFKQLKNATKGSYVNGKPIGDNYQDGVMGDKGIYATCRDLYQLHLALSNGFISDNLLNAAYENSVTEPHRFKKYGMGWRIYEANEKPFSDTKIVYHNGWWHGYRTAFHRRLSDQSCVIVLSNNLSRNAYDGATQAFYILDNKTPIATNDSLQDTSE
jgi:CubicO group peptidase (beta-lactamase class C family)